MSFNAYTAEYVGVSTTMKLFILRANPTAPKTLEGGHLYHVNGNLLKGMTHDPRGSASEP